MNQKTITLEKINNNVLAIKKELDKIKMLLEEEFELSDWAKQELKKARSEKKSISHEKIMKKYA